MMAVSVHWPPKLLFFSGLASRCTEDVVSVACERAGGQLDGWVLAKMELTDPKWAHQVHRSQKRFGSLLSHVLKPRQWGLPWKTSHHEGLCAENDVKAGWFGHQDLSKNYHNWGRVGKLNESGWLHMFLYVHVCSIVYIICLTQHLWDQPEMVKGLIIYMVSLARVVWPVVGWGVGGHTVCSVHGVCIECIWSAGIHNTWISCKKREVALALPRAKPCQIPNSQFCQAYCVRPKIVLQADAWNVNSDVAHSDEYFGGRCQMATAELQTVKISG